MASNIRQYKVLNKHAWIQGILVFYKFFVFVLLVSLSLHGAASTVADLNLGRVIIEDQSTATQETAGRAALEQVFVKLSGSARTLKEPAIQRAVDNFEQYLIASSFLQQGEDLVFEARFNQDQIVSLLKTTGMPIWASLRPNATLWIAHDDPAEGIQWLNQNTAQEFNSRLQQNTFKHGVEILLPLGDLYDLSQITNFDVWTQNTGKLSKQSRRYNTAFTISAVIAPKTEATLEKSSEEALFAQQQQALDKLLNGGTTAAASTHNAVSSDVLDEASFELNWIFKSAQQLHIGKSFLRNIDEAAAILAKEYADMLAKQFTITADQSIDDASPVSLTIQNISSLKDYNQAFELISSMPQVLDVELNQLSGTDAKFSVLLSGNSSALLNLLVYDTRVSSTVGDNDLAQDIRIIWQP